MKIGTKLAIGFMVIASLVGLIGIFSAISHNNIQANSRITTEVLELGILVNESLVELLALNQTENIKDYVREKTDYEQIRAEFDALFKKLDEENEKQLQDLGVNREAFHEDADQLARISNRLIALHKRELAKNKVYKEKKSLEKELRHKIQNALFVLQDNALTRDVELMRYRSQEALYECKDPEYGIQWLESISKIKGNSLVVPLQGTLNDLNAYERVAYDLSKIVVEQETIGTQKHLAFGGLRELINLLEENNERIANEVKAKSQALARNTQSFMFAVVVTAFLVSIILGFTIARSISRPVTDLVHTTQAIAQGDFSVRVDVATADEIGELATSFNKMTEDLEKTTTSIDNLNGEIAERKKTQTELQEAQKKLVEINEGLEIRVEERTADLTREIAEHKQAQIELKETHQRLIEASHRAGMAEVATGVLHNVGNVLNSINVSTSSIRDKVLNSKATNLKKVADLIAEHADELGTFFTEDQRGKHIPLYLTEVARLIAEEQADITEKLQSLTKNVEHVKEIVKTQQAYAGVGGVEVFTSINDIIEDAIQINSIGLKRHGAKLKIDVVDLPEIYIDKQRVLQILVNLVSNAKYALSMSQSQEKSVTVRCYRHGEHRLRIEVTDNGVGIPQENLSEIFRHGFTTKEGGHGFGLHSSALAAKEIGGSLTCQSDGLAHGATFTLELPFKPEEVRQCTR